MCGCNEGKLTLHHIKTERAREGKREVRKRKFFSLGGKNSFLQCSRFCGIMKYLHNTDYLIEKNIVEGAHPH